jgi:hypothetical protein
VLPFAAVLGSSRSRSLPRSSVHRSLRRASIADGLDLGPAVLALRSLAVVVLGLAGCGEDLPRFSELPRDAGIQCRVTSGARDAGRPMDAGRTDGGGGDEDDAGTTTMEDPGEDIPCPSGQVCLAGRCFEECDDDDDCARGESCNSDGACVSRTGPRPDGGDVEDAGGDAGPCAARAPDSGMECTAPTPYCEPLTGTCIACLTRDDCGGGTPICEVAYGACRAFTMSRVCGPCNNDADCSGLGTCVSRTSPNERVCMAACMDGMCPMGFRCMMGTCAPVGSCTGFVAGQDGRSCLRDAECVPLGATPAMGQCTSTDGTTPGTCRIPCGLGTDCPSGSCGGDGFCM